MWIHALNAWYICMRKNTENQVQNPNLFECVHKNEVKNAVATTTVKPRQNARGMKRNAQNFKRSR